MRGHVEVRSGLRRGDANRRQRQARVGVLGDERSRGSRLYAHSARAALDHGPSDSIYDPTRPRHRE